MKIKNKWFLVIVVLLVIISIFCAKLSNHFSQSQSISTYDETHEICKGDYIPPFKPPNLQKLSHGIRGIEKYKIALCHTPKSGSQTIAKAISMIAYENNTITGQKLRDTLKLNRAFDYSYNAAFYALLPPPIEAWLNESDWKNLIVVRHPVSRLYSAYMHFCIAQKGCSMHGADKFEQFVVDLYDMLLNISKDISPSKQMSFGAKNIQYHFYPSTWFCDDLTAQKLQHMRIIKQDSPTFVQDLVDVLREAHVDEEKITEFKQVLAIKSHSFSGGKSADHLQLLKNLVSNNRGLQQCLHKISLHNANLLGYDLVA